MVPFALGSLSTTLVVLNSLGESPPEQEKRDLFFGIQVGQAIGALCFWKVGLYPSFVAPAVQMVASVWSHRMWTGSVVRNLEEVAYLNAFLGCLVGSVLQGIEHARFRK